MEGSPQQPGPSPDSSPRRVAESVTSRALVFTDLVDSTQHVERLGDAAAAAMWAEHDRQSRALVARHLGREIDRSDGFFLVFDDASAAAQFALDYQEVVAAMQLAARIGIHVGAVRLRHNAPEDIERGAKPLEVEGLAKPLAARIMALARGGQILVSGPAQAAIAPTLPVSAAIRAQGHYRLKGIQEPVEIFELGAAGSGFTPPADTEKAYRIVRDGDVWLPVREIRHNLTPERDAFVGRTVELRDLAQRVADGERLITILGAGGTGKTRLVCRYAKAWLGDWPGGVYFCDLSEARSLDGIHFAVAQAIGVPLGKSDPAVRLGHAIAGRGRCLVILDNFEQLVEHAAATVGRWADRAEEACFVVTSREKLQLQGEQVLPIEPLSLGSDAVDLFAVRARAHRPGFALDATNRRPVAEIVRLLDGLPLAIELAAARIRVLSPAQIVERLQDRFSLLAGARGAAARQATLKAAIDWSWNLLTASEQAALAQCSVFEGGFTLEAAEAVIDLAPYGNACGVIDVVQALVDKSLLRTWAPRAQGRFDIDEPYFGMYLSIREYAAERCRDAGRDEQLALERRHGQYFAAFGSDAAIDSLYAPGGIRRCRTLALEVDNLVAACRRALVRLDGECAVTAYGALWQVLNLRGPYGLAAELGLALTRMPGLSDGLRAQALSNWGNALLPLGRLDEALAAATEALDIARRIGDRQREAAALGSLGSVQRWRGELHEARRHLESGLRLRRDLGQRRGEASTLSTLGLLSHELGRIAEAQSYYDAALELLRETGNRLDEGGVLSLLGVLHAEQGRLEEARGHFEQSVAIYREAEDRIGEGEVLTNLGCLHQDLGLLDDAVRYFEDSLHIHREAGNRRFEGYVYGDLGRLHLRRGEWDLARECLERSLGVNREISDRRIEGSELRSLGELYLQMGEDELSRSSFAAAEDVLRQVGDKYYLAFVLCGRADLERRRGELDTARRTHDEANQLAEATHSGPASELGRRLAQTRAALP